MSKPLFPEIARDLASVATRSQRSWRRRALPLVGVGFATVGIAGVATAATGVWSPQIGDEHRGSQVPSVRPIANEQLEHFAVLRREQTDADRGPDSRYLLKLTGRGWDGVRTDGVRLLAPATPGDTTAGARILVPVDNANGTKDALCVGVIDPKDGWGGSCFSTAQVLEGRAIVGIAGSTPQTAVDRAALQKAMHTAHRRQVAARRAAIRRLKVNDYPKGSQARRRAIQTVTQSIQPLPVRGTASKLIDARVYGLVPDGVTSIVRTAPGTAAQTAQVHDNTFEFKTGDDPSPGTLHWQDAEGREIKTVAAP